jgi:hypothetical protein
VFDVEGYVRPMSLERRLAKVLPLHGRSAEREGPTVRVEPGKEGDFAYIRGWLASSEWLDRLIAAKEPEAAGGMDRGYSPGLYRTGHALVTAERRLLQ